MVSPNLIVDHQSVAAVNSDGDAVIVPSGEVVENENEGTAMSHVEDETLGVANG